MLLSEQNGTVDRAIPPLWLRPLTSVAGAIRAGSLTVSIRDGESYTFRGKTKGPDARIVLNSARAVGRIVVSGEVGFAEGYMAGDWDSPDLAALLELGAVNERHLSESLEQNPLTAVVDRIRHLLRRNSRRGSRRNIRYHYDLGNEFYGAWLDASMTYSCALFDHPTQSLEEAQSNKYARVLELLDLSTESHILEIGCGWGGFAETAARAGHRVTGITLSPAQLQYAQTRVRRAGVADRVALQLKDYRDLDERFDHIVSIEMFEAVGEVYWPAFFSTLRNCLKPGGRAMLQVITMADKSFAAYRRGVDFIQRYIFPGGMLPSPSVFAEHAAKGGLSQSQTTFHGSDYARTLAQWERRVRSAEGVIRRQGFDERFMRMWRYYLAYCEAGFRSGRIDLMRTVLA